MSNVEGLQLWLCLDCVFCKQARPYDWQRKKKKQKLWELYTEQQCVSLPRGEMVGRYQCHGYQWNDRASVSIKVWELKWSRLTAGVEGGSEQIMWKMGKSKMSDALRNRNIFSWRLFLNGKEVVCCTNTDGLALIWEMDHSFSVDNITMWFLADFCQSLQAFFSYKKK